MRCIHAAIPTVYGIFAALRKSTAAALEYVVPNVCQNMPHFHSSVSAKSAGTHTFRTKSAQASLPAMKSPEHRQQAVAQY